MTSYDWLIVGIYGTTAAPFLCCAVVYAWSAPWWKRPMGRALMLLVASITAVLLLAIVLRVIDAHGLLAWVLRVVLLGLVQVGGWLLFRQLIRFSRNPSERNGASGV